MDFFETALRKGAEALNIEDLAVPGDSPALGRTLEAMQIRRATGVTILAVLRDGNPLVSPPGDLMLSAGDHLLALGTTDQLEQLGRLIAGGRS